MFELFKNKGASDCVDSYRELTCYNVSSNILTRPLRDQSVNILRRIAPIGQCGSGMNGGGCDFTKLRLTSAIEAADLNSHSFGALFVDLRAAFSSVARQIAYPIPSSVDELATVLQRNRIPFEPHVAEQGDQSENSPIWQSNFAEFVGSKLCR